MNTKQMGVWKEIVYLCKIWCKSWKFGSINVASKTRGEAILAADALVELVTPELAALLGRLANCTLPSEHSNAPDVQQCIKDREAAHALAAKIREALDEHRAT